MGVPPSVLSSFSRLVAINQLPSLFAESKKRMSLLVTFAESTGAYVFTRDFPIIRLPLMACMPFNSKFIRFHDWWIYSE